MPRKYKSVNRRIGVLRDKQILVKVTEREQESIRELAKHENMTITDLILNALNIKSDKD